MTDTYEFEKSNIVQGANYETPYVSSNWNYVPDINGGIYQNAGLSLVTIDMTSIYNSQAMVDFAKAFIAVPLVLVSAVTSSNSAGTLIAPTAQNCWSYAGLKNGYYQVLHQADITLNGKIIETTQPFLNIYTHLKMVSQMSQDDYRSFGQSLGMGTALDNWQSLKLNPYSRQGATTASAYPATATNLAITNLIGGNGLVNNQPFFINTGSTADQGDQPSAGIQFSNTYNNGYYSRLMTVADTSVASSTNGLAGFFGTDGTTGANINNIMTSTQLTNEFKNYFTILNTNYAVSYYTATIRLADIFDSFKNLPLCKRVDGVLRLYFNLGAVGSFVQTVGTAGVMVTSQSTNTFNNTCPIIQSALVASAYGGTACGIVSGLSIAKAGATNLLGGVNLASSGGSHPMPSVRLYYPQVVVKPELLIPYIENNRAKKVCYTSWLFNQFNGITSGSTFSNLIQSGIKACRGVWIVPFQSSTTNGTVNSSAVLSGVTTFAQYQSPFDSAPATNGPFSLTNIQVTLGGSNVLNNVLSYSFENFLEQVTMYEKISGADMGLSNGLIGQTMWENAYRFYYIDCSRSTLSDLLTTKQLNVSFNNNTNCTIDVMFFIEKFNEFNIDVESGLISGI